MRDQYAGDVSDAIKIGLLRTLAGSDRRLGVAWYYEPGDDGRPDGRHLEWRDDPAWQTLDEELHAELGNLGERSIAALEGARIWPPGTFFHREPVETGFKRRSWAIRLRAALEEADLVFLDPDNGIGKETPKHATMEEIGQLRRPGRAIVIITFPGRRPHQTIIEELHEGLRQSAGASEVMTLRSNVSVPATRAGMYVQGARWFTIVDPGPSISARAREFADRLSKVPRVRATISGGAMSAPGPMIA